jgi:hypothetical protein
MHNHLVMNSPKEHLKNTSLDNELDAILADSGTTDLLQKLNEHEVYLTPTSYFRRSTSGSVHFVILLIIITDLYFVEEDCDVR